MNMKVESIVSIGFIAVSAILILIGIWAVGTPVVAMCLLVILEAALAGMMHHAELWVHGVLILAELIAGVISGKIVLTVMCVIVYAAATAMLQAMDKGEVQNG
jgi:hypothetical protein